MALERPYSEQAERAILGSMLVDTSTVSYCISVLRLEDFYISANQMVFEAISALFDDRAKIDMTSVATKLKDLGNLDAVGGVSFLVELTEGVVSTNVAYYIDILKDKTNLRRLAEFLDKSYNEFADKSTQDIHHYLNTFEEEVLAITRARSVSDFVKMDNLIDDYQKLLSEKKIKSNGLTTGYSFLDGLLNGGWQNGNLIIVAARPGVGKTALTLNFAINAATATKTPVAFFSIEMSSLELTYRMISITGRIESKKVQNGNFNNSDDMIRLDQACKKLKNMPIYIDDTPKLDLYDFIAKVRKLKGEIPSLGLVIVDYLQIIDIKVGKNESRERAVAKIATELKSLARELNIPIIALAQLSRKTDTNKFGNKASSEKRPELGDLRESGQIEQDADIVAFIYKDSFYQTYNEGEQPETEDIEFIIKKNRNGRTGRVFLVSSPACYKYDSKIMTNEEMED